jgi:hypothetical protein
VGCGEELLADASFCTKCGRKVKDSRGKALKFAITTASILAVAAIMVVILQQETDVVSPAPGALGPGAPAGAPTAGSPPPLTGTLREQADRLFNRIMQARQSGDTAQARFFLPMAIQAYEGSGDLDADGLYHLSMLQTFAGDGAAARANAESILAQNPTHLLGLHAAASAAFAQNTMAAARGYYERLLEAYPTEKDKQLPEYEEHRGLLPELETEAKGFLRNKR